MSTIAVTPFRLKDSKMMVLRSATPADAGQILEHAHAIFAEGEFVLSTPEDFHMTEEQEVLWLQTNLDDPGKIVIVAENESQIIGMLDFHHGERKRIAHQGEFGISVNRAWRNQGIGRALLATLLRWAQEQPAIEKVCLEVFATNTRAISLYQDLGFQEEGRFAKQIKLAPRMYIDTIRMGRFVK